MRTTALALLALAGLGAGAVPASAQDAMEVPTAIQVPLFIKVMTFDRQLRTRAGEQIVIAVAYQSGNRASVTVKDEVLRLLAAARESIEGMTIRAVAIDLDGESLREALRIRRATVLYVTPVRGVRIGDVAAAARAEHVTTMTGVPRHISAGLAVGVRLQGDRPRLLVNLTAARLEGAEFSAELLKLVQVVE